MTPARMRRIASDYEEVKKNFAGNRNIIVTPVGEEPPEKYHVTYFVNGIYMLPDGKIESLSRHEVEIFLHADYPRYKPICKILTPIWHPNFRDGQICIGDIWGAGESLSDIIINIGNMIQYKSWNSFSPLSSEAAQWAIENKEMFPVGNLELHYNDYASEAEKFDIEMENPEPAAATPASEDASARFVSEPEAGEESGAAPASVALPESAPAPEPEEDGNDFEITAEELEGIEFVPTAQRMQSLSQKTLPNGKKVNFKTVLSKGVLWALIGAILGVLLTELTGLGETEAFFARLFGKPYLAEYFDYQTQADKEYDIILKSYRSYCKKNHLSADDDSNMSYWLKYGATSEDLRHTQNYLLYEDLQDSALHNSYKYEFDRDDDKLLSGLRNCSRLDTALWSGVLALFIGLLLGIGEGVYYGSKEKALLYGLLGAAISFVIGFGSGYLAQLMYGSINLKDSSLFFRAFIRAVGWMIMGVGIGLAVGLIKPEGKRIVFCTIGGAIGAFLGGFLFDFVCEVIPNDVVARTIGIVLMGVLIGVGVGLLEQFSKQAWLKVIRGEFEGKEYLVFAGTTSIGNNGKNTIVLFKDKLVGDHHCDIVQEGRKYYIVDCGTPMGTVVNGMRVVRQPLHQGDAISVGNSVLVFNTK